MRLVRGNMLTNKEFSKISRIMMDLCNHAIALRDAVKEVETMKND